MALDAFIKIDGIEGESTDDRHPGWIEVISFETAQKQRISSTASSAGGASAERTDFKDFTFAKLIDKSSPLLSVACAEGRHFDSITIELCRAGTEKVKYYSYKLSNCMISKITSGGGRGEFPSEVLDINYGKIEWVYVQQNREGGGSAGQIAACWDLQRNCKA